MKMSLFYDKSLKGSERPRNPKFWSVFEFFVISIYVLRYDKNFKSEADDMKMSLFYRRLRRGQNGQGTPILG